MLEYVELVLLAHTPLKVSDTAGAPCHVGGDCHCIILVYPKLLRLNVIGQFLKSLRCHSWRSAEVVIDQPSACTSPLEHVGSSQTWHSYSVSPLKQPFSIIPCVNSPLHSMFAEWAHANQGLITSCFRTHAHIKHGSRAQINTSQVVTFLELSLT